MRIRKQARNIYLNSLSYVGKLALAAIVLGSAMVPLAGCAVQVRGQQRPLVSVDHFQGQLDLSMEEYTNESTSSRASSKVVNTIFEEELLLQAQGNVYHPNMMTYLAMLGLGWDQRSFDSGGETDDGNGSFTRYRLNMRFLPLKPYPFNISFDQTDTLVHRRFLSPLRVESSSAGASVRMKIPDWPMTLAWSSSETEQKSDDPDDINLYARSSQRLGYTLLHDFSEQSHLTFRSDWDKLSSSHGDSSTDTDTSHHRLLHNLDFGSSQQHSLDSSLRFLDKSGTFENQTFDWNETLFLNHSNSVSTFYNASFSRNTFGSITSDTVAGTAGFNHQLYLSLLTSFNLFYNSTEFSSGSRSTFQGGTLSFDYTRNNPWGQLSSEYLIRMTNAERTGLTGAFFVIGESHTADIFDFFTLDERNIDVSSIVVTDSTGTEVYTEGDDYIITVVDDWIEIRVTDLGVDLPNITDGQSLLIDYTFTIKGAIEEDSVEQYFRIEQEFDNGLSVYYSHDRRDEEIDFFVGSAITTDDFKTDIFGADYRYKRLLLRAEHSKLTSVRNSTETTRLSGRYVWRVSPRTNLSAGIAQSWQESGTDGDSRQTSLFKATGNIRTRLGKHLSLSGNADWRHEDSSDVGRTEGLTMGAALEYNYRAFSFEAGWDSYLLDRRGIERNDSLFYLRLSRRF